MIAVLVAILVRGFVSTCSTDISNVSWMLRYIACAKHIAWYQKKYNCNFMIDAYKGDLKDQQSGS